MWDPITNGIHETRNVVWMRHMFYNKNIGQYIVVPPMILPGIDLTPAPIREGDDDPGLNDLGIVVGENDPGAATWEGIGVAGLDNDGINDTTIEPDTAGGKFPTGDTRH